MSTSENLVKAAINRIGARLNQKLIDLASELSLAAQDGPEKLQKEWDLFQEEVIDEANRLDQESQKSKSSQDQPLKDPTSQDLKDKIDSLRSILGELNTKLEEKN